MRNLKGIKGERLATEYLEKKGYKIVEKNYTNKVGEIDIIAYLKKEKTTVFVEVKYRTNTKFGLPREAVNYTKQNKIKMVSLVYMQKNNLLNEKVRFDVIEILSEEITHIINAF